jgi:hypothetical protein
VAPAHDPGAFRRRRLRLVLLTVLLSIVFGGVLVALAAGVAPNRLRPVAGFLAVVSIAAILSLVDSRAAFRRAWKQRNSEVPWGVLLTPPFWMRLSYPILLLGAGAVLGAVAAALGFPGIGLGALLTLGAVGGMGPFFDSPHGLTFEPDGLRVTLRRGSFVVPWKTITHLEGIGPDHFTMISMHIGDARPLIESAQPNDPRFRAKVATFVQATQAHQGKLLLMPWTAGLDGQVLVRIITGATVDGQRGRMN